MRNHNILPYTKDARELARQLRKQMTKPEKIFWQATKSSQLDVIMRRQMPILDYPNFIHFKVHLDQRATKKDYNSRTSNLTLSKSGLTAKNKRIL